MRTLGVSATILLLLLASVAAHAQEPTPADRWLARFSMHEAPVEPNGVQAPRAGSSLPSFDVTPNAPGKQLVRVSLPFAPGTFPAELGLSLKASDTTLAPGARILTRHPGKPASIRRAILTFAYDFPDTATRHFEVRLNDAPKPDPQPLVEDAMGWHARLGDLTLDLSADQVSLTAPNAHWQAKLLAPACAAPTKPKPEFVESNAHYLWLRLLEPDTEWPRIIEVKLDSLGTVAVQAHVQRLGVGDATAPDLGWDIAGPPLPADADHPFKDGSPLTLIAADNERALSFPTAPYLRRGKVSAQASGTVRYLRCTADENVPFQESAWRSAGFVIGTTGHTPRDPRLDPVVDVRVAPSSFDAAYSCGVTVDTTLYPTLDDLRRYTRAALVKSALTGDDFGNVTIYQNEDTPASIHGMNRLNHAPAMFAEAWRTNDLALRDTAVQWCSNMYDLSLWWADKEGFGGTRYNNASAGSTKAHQGDPNFMWRENNAVHFCTKGYDSFLYAYEETGDPRMLVALDAQLAYARENVHVDRGECRNVGDAVDFMHLYRRTGLAVYRDEALRLFRELRNKIGEDNLFSQGGQPIVPDSPFINDDAHGYEAPFAKPYIIGYALAGLPDLLRECPDEPRLRDVVRAVADFLARSQDPTGGWRYPHPASAWVIISQSIEHAMQLTRAAKVLKERGENVDNLVDAIERTLQMRVQAYARSGNFASGLGGWETAAGLLKDGKTMYDLYKKASDRDPSRDYTEGEVSVGGASPESLAHYAEVIDFYLTQRPAERLFTSNPKAAAVLARIPDRRIKLTPQPKGAFLRMERPDNPEVGFTLWGPEWVNFPNLNYSEEQLGGMAIDWKRDAASGTVSYTLDRPEATFSASFEPHLDYVACTYTTSPKLTKDPLPASQFAVGPCQQMKAGVFEGDDADLMKRMFFLTAGGWTALDACANGNYRNVLYLAGQDSPEQTGGMLEGGWKTIQSARPTLPLMVCASRDGAWTAGIATENATLLCNNANASHRCMHAQGGIPLQRYAPTTIRMNAYLVKGGKDAVLARYQQHRAAWTATSPAPTATDAARYAIKANLPTSSEAMARRLAFPLAWPNANMPFGEWRDTARKTLLDAAMLAPPRVPFSPIILATEDRGTYEARKLALNLSADSRVIAYLLVPKGEGPFPAVLALHDHGAHFSIGKEKVIRPFGESEERLKDAEDWVGKCYGGRFFGDELAKRGYVVFATDMLFWGDRGRAEGIAYETQQTLASNLLQLGTSWAGTILWNDLRCAEFLQGLPEVNPDRVAAAGLSVGCYRTWNLAAASDIIKAGVAICWMGDTATLMAEGNNQTTGQSAFSMIHPGLRNAMDYPDAASIAAPKPMLFYNGEQDGLFPVSGVKASYERLRKVWGDQNASDRLETRIWPVPHLFNAEMQDTAFDWLDRWMKPKQ